MDEPASHDGSPPSDSDDPNDFFMRLLYDAIQRLTEAGMAEGDAALEAVGLLHKTVEEMASGHAESLRLESREYIENTAEFRSGFAERLRDHWGEALDLYEVIVSIAEQGGVIFAQRSLGQASDRELLLELVVQLNGQAIRVAREVHALLSAGFPLGALAAARTIHELSVLATVLSEYGARDESRDLPERFVQHDRVINYEDAKVYQRDADKLGYTPFTEAEMAEMKTRRDDAIERYGKPFGRPYGWAVGLPGVSIRPQFVELERLAGLEHHRGVYKWSSHFVHGDSKSLRLGRVERGGSSAVLTNATNAMLADPGQHALYSLNRVFVSMVTAVEMMTFYDQLICQSLQVLLAQAAELFVDAEKSVDDAEEQFQAELAARGLRFDLVAGEVPIEDVLEHRSDPKDAQS